MGPHGGTAKTAHRKERSIVPQELHLKALSCYVGLPAELLLPTNASKCNCQDGEWKRAVSTEQCLIAHPVNLCIKLSSTLSDTFSSLKHYGQMGQDTVDQYSMRRKTNCLEAGMQREVCNHPRFFKEWAWKKMMRIMRDSPSAKWGVIGIVLAAYIKVRVDRSSLCFYPQRCGSVFCVRGTAIHPQMHSRGELSNKKMGSRAIFLKTHKERLLDWRNSKAHFNLH